MASRIEDYAMISDTQTAALVGRDGCIDWLSFPRFDSPACFAALLGTREHGRWYVGPKGGPRAVSRRYRDGSLVLETTFECDAGTVRLIDFMPPRGREPDVVRLVEGVAGRVEMEMELIVRFDYGSVVPWVRKLDGSWHAIAGPDALLLDTPVELAGKDFTTVASFTVGEGDRVPFTLAWYPSHERAHEPIDPLQALEETQAWWNAWTDRCTYEGEWKEAVDRSLLVLKGLTYGPTGGIVAAPTTSLPERIGGVRNWDYRFCWLRDATFTLYSLITGGYTEEAVAWRDWLVRAVAGHPAQLHIMYGVAGERRLPELELPWLPGYEGSSPVRIGNAAVEQFQLDVFGEVMDAMHVARGAGMEPDARAWEVQRTMLDFLESAWQEPDEGIWEVRGDRQHFTHSKVMAWVAFDRGIKAIERSGLDGPVDRWRALRDRVEREVHERGFDADRNAFVQAYGSKELDASLLVLPLVGFIEAKDERMVGTVRAIEQELVSRGFVYRYSHESPAHIDGLPPGEGAFLPCTFWLADNLVLQGRRDDALRTFERLMDIRNDVGLLAEEYDPESGRQLGNFPQAFTHVTLINTIRTLTGTGGPTSHDPAERTS